MNILNDVNIILCPIKNDSYTIELTVHNSCYWVLDLLCVIYAKNIEQARLKGKILETIKLDFLRGGRGGGVEWPFYAMRGLPSSNSLKRLR